MAMGTDLMGRLLIAVIVMVLAGRAVAAADDFPYPQTVTFSATRNGEQIGLHTLTFAGNSAQRIVTVSVDIAVKIAGVTAYRYTHRSKEIWAGDQLQSLAGQTDDNGTRYVLKVERAGDALAVEHEEILPIVQAEAFDQGLPQRQVVKEVIPGNVMPTSHWNTRQASQSVLLNTQHGVRSNIQVSKIGRENVRTSTRAVEATHYRYSGDVRMDQWFDDKGRWVKASFAASDGSVIEYTLQE